MPILTEMAYHLWLAKSHTFQYFTFKMMYLSLYEVFSGWHYITNIILQGNQVHQLQHFGHKEKSSKKIASGEGGAVVYSLSYHPRHPCLLSVGAQGPVKVWKGPEWNNEDEET